MNVTIYSDASLCPQTRAAGWAGWIKSDRGTIVVDGMLKASLRDTTIAEAMAAINSLNYAIHHKAIQAGDVVVINTDNDNVMNVLQGKAKRRVRRKIARGRRVSMKDLRVEVREANEHIAKISRRYARLVTDVELDVRWYHVKGHRGTKDKRSAVNHGCDSRARAAMKAARKKARDITATA